MLILFHLVSIFIFQILRKRHHRKDDKKTDTNVIESEITEIELENSIRFDPPVYLQRYGAVYRTLIDERWRKKITKLCDFGCAEFGLFVFVKQLTRLTNLVFVDIDEDLLTEYSRKVYPLTIEYLKRREEPLQVNIFAGSVGDPDYHLLNTDVVTCIEIIEHLYPDVLDAFPYNVFNYIEPKLVIVTTPNADFNVVFSSDPKKFRHYDHKFEWSRKQFEEWANNIVSRFPDYDVSFSGMGDPPIGSEHLGQCSQMAVFIRKDIIDDNYILKKYLTPCQCPTESPCKTIQDMMSCKCICSLCTPSYSHGVCTYCSYSTAIIEYEMQNVERNSNYNMYYKQIEQIDYPFERDSRTEEEKLMDEFRYRINNFGHQNSRFYVEERERAEIPLTDLLYGPNFAKITEIELSKLLIKHNYQVEECIIQETNQLETCVIFKPLMDKRNSSSDESDLETNSGYFQSANESTSDWDDAQQSQRNATSRSTKKSESKSETVQGSEALKNSLIQNSQLHNQPTISLTQHSISQSPIEEQEETDLFEETPSTPSLSSEDNKVHLKKASNVEKSGFPPPSPPLPIDLSKMKLDFNRINELDRFHNVPLGRNFFSHFLRPQASERLRKNFLKERESLPGPSNLPKKRKKFKVGSMTSNSEDDVSPLDDMKSVTNCIVENTLNMLDVDDVKANKDDVIEFNIEPVDSPCACGCENEDQDMIIKIPDIINNNPDSVKSEGNPHLNSTDNFPESPSHDENFSMRLPVDLSPIEHNICNLNTDNNLASSLNLGLVSSPITLPSSNDGAYNQDDSNQDVDFRSVARASREAIVDPNSVHDLLEDFDVTPSVDALNAVDIVEFGNVILVGIHPLPDNLDTQLANGFPNWLLQILGTQVPLTDAPLEGSLEEPHYYCQGDGLGVHPSVVAVEVDEEDDQSTESSNNTNTTDFAEVDPIISSQDNSSLPEDSAGNTFETPDPLEEEHVGLIANSGTETTLDSISNSSDTGLGTSKSS